MSSPRLFYALIILLSFLSLSSLAPTGISLAIKDQVITEAKNKILPAFFNRKIHLPDQEFDFNIKIASLNVTVSNITLLIHSFNMEETTFHFKQPNKLIFLSN